MERPNWKARCLEAEAALEDVSKALELIPIEPLANGQVWMPSEVAIHLLRRAKDSVTGYVARHWTNGKY
jgi:hypothetical protein